MVTPATDCVTDRLLHTLLSSNDSGAWEEDERISEEGSEMSKNTKIAYVSLISLARLMVFLVGLLTLA